MGSGFLHSTYLQTVDFSVYHIPPSVILIRFSLQNSTVLDSCRGRLAQMVRASGLHPEGPQFDPVVAHQLTVVDFEQYRSSICARLLKFELVPYRVVSSADWKPEASHCHANVDRWVKENPGHTAVRGWATEWTDGGTKFFLAHHSVVRGEDGRMFDITPLDNQRMRGHVRFIPHVGSDSEFFQIKNQVKSYLECDTATLS